jgi:DNA repair protein SbcD/Mre11
MKFAHIADIHIGGWKEEKLNSLGIEAFRRAIDNCIAERVGFVIIAGDLFNTALPNIDLIKEVSSILRKLRDDEIECYVIPGSHDFSPSGKTMIDVLENAGLVFNVMNVVRGEDDLKLNFVTDKTGVKLTGLYGKAAGLEKLDYNILDKSNLESELGFKIFLFHHILEEYKPGGFEMIEGIPLNKFPKGFDYYAGGHPHVVMNENVQDYGVVTYPGALFPNNFAELEKYKGGGFYIVNVQDSKIEEVKHVFIKLKEVEALKIDVDGMSSISAQDFILEKISSLDVNDKIVLLRVKGVLSSGKVSDIDFSEIFSRLEGAYIILKNTNKLQSKEIVDLEIETGSTDDIESKFISEFKSEFNSIDVSNFVELLGGEKVEGETNTNFEKRLEKNMVKILSLGDFWDVN